MNESINGLWESLADITLSYLMLLLTFVLFNELGRDKTRTVQNKRFYNSFRYVVIFFKIFFYLLYIIIFSFFTTHVISTSFLIYSQKIIIIIINLIKSGSLV